MFQYQANSPITFNSYVVSLNIHMKLLLVKYSCNFCLKKTFTRILYVCSSKLWNAKITTTDDDNVILHDNNINLYDSIQKMHHKSKHLTDPKHFMARKLFIVRTVVGVVLNTWKQLWKILQEFWLLICNLKLDKLMLMYNISDCSIEQRWQIVIINLKAINRDLWMIHTYSLVYQCIYFYSISTQTKTDIPTTKCDSVND